ncbi:hypothetical protein EK904_006380, partial [Melospiza melodia maxima]
MPVLRSWWLMMSHRGVLLKTLSDKSRDAKKIPANISTVTSMNSFVRRAQYKKVICLFFRYEDAWAALHKGAKDCAKAGELVDSEVVMLSAHWEKKRSSLVELQDQLQQIPGFLADLECLTASLAQLEANFEEMENHLLCLEELCEQCELERYKCMQTLQLENYKKTKRKELETFKESQVVNIPFVPEQPGLC